LKVTRASFKLGNQFKIGLRANFDKVSHIKNWTDHRVENDEEFQITFDYSQFLMG
jgi:hypothetical protein